MSDVKTTPYPLPDGYRWGSKVKYENNVPVVIIQLREVTKFKLISRVIAEDRVTLIPSPHRQAWSGPSYDTSENVQNISRAQRMLADFATTK